MRYALVAVASAVMAAVAVPASAQGRPGLSPSSAWTLDYAADSCALRRMFGEGDDRFYLEFRRFGPGLGLQTTIASSGMKPRRSVSFRYRLGSETKWRQAVAANSITLDTPDSSFEGVLFDLALVSSAEAEASSDPLQRAAYLESIDLRALEREAAGRADAITLRGAFRRELTLSLGSLEAPIAALNECIDELMTGWNIDLDAHRTLTRPATPVNLRRVASMIDYPPKMALQNMPGVVNIRLAIDERGRITGCHIQMPLSDPSFEESSCVDVQHALDFDPALDKDGHPIASYWITKVHFRPY
jgi:hypothetical protein